MIPATYTLTKITTPREVRACISCTSKRHPAIYLRTNGYIPAGLSCYAIRHTGLCADGTTWEYTQYFRQEKHARAWYETITKGAKQP